MTREQINMAAAVRDELRLMFDAVLPMSRSAVVLEGICQHYQLPAPDATLVPKIGAAVLAVEAALTAYEEFSAVLSVQTGDAGAGASAPVPAEPLEAAA